MTPSRTDSSPTGVAGPTRTAGTAPVSRPSWMGAGRGLSARQVRWFVGLAIAGIGVIDLVVTAAHGAPAPHGRGLGVRLARAALWGPYLLPVAAMALVTVCRGLLHGKRNAWIVSVAAVAASAVGTHAHGQDLLGGLPSLVVLGVLLLARGSFRAGPDPTRPRDALRVLLVGEATVFVYGTLGLYLLDSQFLDSSTVMEALGDALRSMVLLAPSSVSAANTHGRWLLESIRVGALIAVFLGATKLILAYVPRRPTPSERAVVVDLLDRWGDSSLAPFHLLGDKQWFVTPAADGFVGYVLAGRAAVALGEPVAAPNARAETARRFCAFCETNGWTPAFHQVSPSGALALAAAGMKVAKIGEEAVVDVRNWTIDGPEHKSLRSAIRRIERAGYDAVELEQPLDDATLVELRRVSDAWMGDGRHRERTFTVGQFGADYLRTTRVIAVRHRETAQVAAFANLVDTYRSTAGNFDLMRRDPDAPNGVMEYLFVALIERFRQEGYEGMTLGLAPMANITGDATRDRAMRLAYERGERLFNYQGLRRFKDKWSPNWEPRYVGYRSEADLPRVALAIARAGELPDSRSAFGRVRAIGRRLPATLTLGGLVIWLMAVTSRSPALHPQLLRDLGLAWRDLVHLQIWRLPTSQLIETRPGFLWSNIALFVLALPVAEWRLGTRRAVGLFFLCDWCSTLLTLAALRVGSWWSPTAAHILTVRDGGPSAGAWALAIAAGLSISGVARRRVAAGAMFTFLAAAVVFHHRLFDSQHILAAMTAAAVVTIARGKHPWRHRP